MTPELPAGYLGDAVCQSCHQDKVQTFHRTSHYLTSRLPEKDSILGKFTPDANVMKTSNPELFFRMEEKDNGFFQTAVQGLAPFVESRTERFAFVVGSGGKGQTYLFWKGDDLFQLPVSYWTEMGWVNSPGYRDGQANFARPIIPRCLECHGTYSSSSRRHAIATARPASIVGITCEKCHGFAKNTPSVSPAGAGGRSQVPPVWNPARFSRDRQMDLCASCHATPGYSLQPAFSYVPDQPLDKYLKMPEPDRTAPIDVHGSQVEMLERSQCFQQSAMTCLTCHNVHTVQHDLTEFSQRCLARHKPGSATFPKRNH